MQRLKDIAKMAGVSPTTVSNVIHNKEGRVSRDTADRVRKVLEENGYAPDVSARMLAAGCSGVICVLAENSLKNVERRSEAYAVIKRLEQEICRRNYNMVLHFADSAEEHLQFISMWKAEGVITIGLGMEQNRRIQARGRMPVVSIDGAYERMEIAVSERENKGTGEIPGLGTAREVFAVPNVGTDDFGGGYLMGVHLLQCGHRKIQFFADTDSGAGRQRWKGLKKAYMEAGISLEQEAFSPLPQGMKKRKKFYKEHLAALAFSHDVLFFASDYYAAEAEGYLRDLGIQVPEEISVAGFGNSECALLGRPRLTTVHQEIPAKAEAAVRKLIGLLEGDGRVVCGEILPVRLVVRESVQIVENRRLWG